MTSGGDASVTGDNITSQKTYGYNFTKKAKKSNCNCHAPSCKENYRAINMLYEHPDDTPKRGKTLAHTITGIVTPMESLFLDLHVKNGDK
jgi:hypothetical protein